MGQAFLVRRGGMDRNEELNFTIVGSTAKPANPDENTIWVNTEQKMTGWTLQHGEPDEPQEGLIWIQLAEEAGVTFNALKSNELVVSAIGCMQYGEDSWTEREAQIYMNGEWMEWIKYIVKDGLLVQDMEIKGNSWVSGDSYGSNNPALTQKDGYVQFTGTKLGYGMAYLKDVNLTGFKEIVVEGTFTPKDYVRLCVWSQLGTYLGSNIAAYVKLSETGGRISIEEKALSGQYIVGITSQASYVQKISAFYIR